MKSLKRWIHPRSKSSIISFFEKVKCSCKVRIIINIDVLNPEYLFSIKNYLDKLGIERNIEIDVNINRNPAKNWYGAHARAIDYLFSKIETPFYLHLEDDWIFLKYIELDPLIVLMEKHHDVDVVRFSKEQIKEKIWLYYLSDEVTEEYLAPNVQCLIDNVPLVQSPVWSFNPHLGRTSIVKNMTDMPKDQNPEKYICFKYLKEDKRNGIYIYGKIGDSPVVKDIGRNAIRRIMQKIKYVISGGKYVKYRF